MNLPPGLGGFHDPKLSKYEEKESIPEPTQSIHLSPKKRDGRRNFEYREDEEDDFALVHQFDTVSETLIGKKERELLRRVLHGYTFFFLSTRSFFFFSKQKQNRQRLQRRETSFRNDCETLCGSSGSKLLVLHRYYGCINTSSES